MSKPPPFNAGSRQSKWGRPLPPIVVWFVTGAESYDIRDLLPDGGIILVVSTECDACLESSEELIVNKATSWRQYVETIIVGDHVLGLAGFVQKLRERGVFTAVYCDVQETLRRVHEITPNPAYFLLGTSGIVLDFGADVPAAAALTTFFNK